MTDKIKLSSEEVRELALLYLSHQDIKDKTPEQLLKTYADIRKQFQDAQDQCDWLV